MTDRTPLPEQLDDVIERLLARAKAEKDALKATAALPPRSSRCRCASLHHGLGLRPTE
jgi:hypothetical protein